MSRMAHTLVEVAQMAGKIALSKRAEHLDVYLKENGSNPSVYDIVTNADMAVEAYIINNLSMRYSSFEIVSEETHPSDDVPQNCFVVDPIDGTINYANGVPLWGVQIACVMGGRTVAAVIHLPEVGRTYSADEEGAYLNGKKISVSTSGLDEGLYSIEGADRMLGRTEMLSRGYHNLRDFYSTCASFAMVAGGTSVASVYACSHPWDYLPGEFIVKMAGGRVHDDFERNVHIVANSREVLEEMKSIFCACGVQCKQAQNDTNHDDEVQKTHRRKHNRTRARCFAKKRRGDTRGCYERQERNGRRRCHALHSLDRQKATMVRFNFPV